MSRAIEWTSVQITLMREVVRAWAVYKSELRLTETRIRELIKAEREPATAEARMAVTRALRAANEAKVSKVKLKELTTSDPLTFASLISPTELMRSTAA